MKSLVILCVIAFAQASIDWNNVSPVRQVYTPPEGIKVPNFIPRIAGGIEAVPNSIPYQIGLFMQTEYRTYFCGGSLISQNYVLTAAHCLDGKNIVNIKVVLGAHELKAEEETQQIINSTEFKIHEEYVSSSTILNDIAVIKLSRPAILNDYVQTIPLPDEDDASKTFEGDLAKVSGWGKMSDGSLELAPKLQVVESDIISNKACDDWYFAQNVIRSTHICLNGERFESPCGGDSGGPLVIDGKQIGIVSFGIMFGCQSGWPGAFTRLTAYRDWVVENTDLEL